jgi:hypothetical protein
MKKYVVGIVSVSLSVWTLTVDAAPQSDNPSTASVILSEAVGDSVSASLRVIPNGSELIIESIQVSGEFAWLMLKTTKNVSVATIKITAALLTAAALDVGASVFVSVEAMGYAIQKAGDTLCFVPNEKAQKHLYRRKIRNDF